MASASTAAAKFDAVEVCENDLLFLDGTARDVRQMAEQLGLKIALFQPFRDFEAVPEAQFRRNPNRAERKFDLMDELAANPAGIVTPLATGLIVKQTGSFVYALAFIAVIALIGAFSYIFIPGSVRRVEFNADA